MKTAKNKLPARLFGIIALSAAIVFMAAGCKDPGGNPQTFTVTFNANGGAPAPQAQDVADGGKASQPPAMTRSGFAFGGWYKESGLFNQWNFNADTVTRNIVLYAKWTADNGNGNGTTTFTVTFNANGGAPAPQAQTVASGGKASQPPAMTRSGFAFGGWYREAALTNQWNFASDSVTANITLYAKWDLARATDGLIFALLNSGNAYSVSKGTATAAAVVIPSFHEGMPVTEIAANGFSNYANMTSITIPSSITSVGQYAFNNCTSLASLTLPSSVTSISSNVLSGCTAITSVTVPFLGSSLGGSSGHIGYIFGASGYSGQNVNIPASLKTVVITGGNNIPANAFNGCTGLSSVILPGGTGAATGWSVAIPSTVVSIGNSAFQGCTGLKNVAIGGSVASVGDSAFSGCSSLTSVEIGDSVTSIGSQAFSGCSSLTSVEIGGSVTSIGSSAFSGCSSLTSITIPFVGGTGTASTHFGYIFGASTSYNGYGASIPASLKTVVITGGSSIPADAFRGCTGLANVTIPDSVTSIGDAAFYDCTGLESVTIPNSVTIIGGSAFSGCTGLESVTIGSSVTSIGGYAFYGCTSLASVTIGSSVTSIGGYAFSDCTSLESVTIPNSVTSIGDKTFYNCESLESVTIGSGVESIGSGAFYHCTSLTSITIPNSVTTIADRATNSRGAFEACTSLASVTIGSGVKTIGNSAFSGCTGLASVTIPSSVTSIGDNTFSGCTGLESVTMGSGVKTIGSSAFYGCTGLTNVACLATTPPMLGGNAFNNTASTLQIKVPAGSVSAYQAAAEWSVYSGRISAM